MAEIVAETERLILRDWQEGDRDAFFAIMNTPAVMEHLGGVQTPEQWAGAFDRLLSYQREDGHTFWIVVRKDGGTILGFCGLKRANAPGARFQGDMEIGWRLREDAWGQGFATEAATASLDLAFGRFAAPHVVAMTARGNLPSQAVMKRLGMIRREELDYIDVRFPVESEINPQIVWSIDAADWARCGPGPFQQS